VQTRSKANGETEQGYQTEYRMRLTGLTAAVDQHLHIDFLSVSLLPALVSYQVDASVTEVFQVYRTAYWRQGL